MRFLILTQYYPPETGAPQTRLASMAKELQRLGHQVEVVTAMPNHPTGRVFPEYRGRLYCREAHCGLPVHRVWLFASTGAGLRRMMNYASFTAMSLFGLCRVSRPDYLFVESPPLFLSLPGFLFSRLWGAKMIFNVADLWPDSVRELGLMKDGFVLHAADRLEAWTYRVSDYVNAVTEGNRVTLAVKKAVPTRKILFLPNGVDTSLFRPQPPDQTVAERFGLVGKKLIIFAGTLGYAQGLDVALDAAGMLSDQSDVRFVFVGDGSDKARLKLEAKQRGLSNVVFLNPVPLGDVAQLYSLALAGLATLRNVPLFEGVRPSKIFPIMASGVPVLYSGAGEGARLVDAAQAGLVTPPEDAQALAGAVRRLAGDPDLSIRLGTNGREYVEQHHAWSALVSNWVEQLQAAEREARREGR